MKRAVITILGTIGGRFDQNKKEFIFVENTQKSYYYSADDIINIKNKKEYQEDKEGNYINTLPLLVDSFDCAIIPIFTKEAKKVQIDVLKKLSNIQDRENIFNNKYFIEDENNFDKIFKTIHTIINDENYDKLIIDVTHGFRHLPLLMLIELIITNFRDTSKIEKILFAKEDIKPIKDNKFIGKYEIIDLKEYLDLANISFILNTFNENYTVASHIKSNKYNELIDRLNDFSNDIMALNLNNLYKNSSKRLIKELKKIDNISIKPLADKLISDIESKFYYENKKRYEIYLELAEDLYLKNYTLLTLSLLYESSRMYIKTTIKKQNKTIVEKVEECHNEDWFKIGDFFKNLSWKNYDKLSPKDKNCLTLDEYNQLVNSYPEKLKEKISFKGIPNLTKDATIVEHIANTRNNLSHANSKGNFTDIQTSIEKLLEKYKDIIGSN